MEEGGVEPVQYLEARVREWRRAIETTRWQPHDLLRVLDTLSRAGAEILAVARAFVATGALARQTADRLLRDTAQLLLDRSVAGFQGIADDAGFVFPSEGFVLPESLLDQPWLPLREHPPDDDQPGEVP